MGFTLPSAPKKSGTPLADVLKQNAKSRATIAAAGEKDPTKKKGPSALERIFGPLDALGTGVRSIAYNAVSDEDVDILAEMGKALKGEKRVEGADILGKLGVDDKWGKMLGGFAVDVLLDPLTYLTLGYGSAAKSGGKGLLTAIAKYGDNVDDVAKAAGVATDVAEAGIAAARPFLDDAGKLASSVLSDRKVAGQLTDALSGVFGRGGVKFAGVSLGGDDAVSKLGRIIKGYDDGAKARGLRALPGARWAEQTFGIGSLPDDAVDLFREGNDVVNTLVRSLRSEAVGKVKLNDVVAERFGRELAEAIPDDAARKWATVAISKQFGDDAPKLADKVDAVRAAIGAKDADAVTAALDDLTEFRRGLLAKAQPNIEATLRQAGLSDDVVRQTLDGIGKYESRLDDLYRQQKELGLLNIGLFGDDAKGYLPGVPVEQMDDAATDVAQRLGIDTAALEAQKHQPSPFLKRTMRPEKQTRKEYLTPVDRMLGRTRDADQRAAALDEAIKAAKYRAAHDVDAPVGQVARLETKKRNTDVIDAVSEMVRDATRLDDGSMAAAARWDEIERVIGEYPRLFKDGLPKKGVLTELDLANLGKIAQSKQGRQIALKEFQDDLAATLGDNDFAARAAESLSKVFTDDEATKTALRTLDRATNLWKRQATIMRFPAFQSRNALSNKILMFQDGAFSVAGEAKSLGLVERMVAKKLTEADAALLDEMVEHGVITTFEELSEQVGKAGGSKVTRWLGKVNEVIENQSRISAYLTFRDKGLGKAAAGEMTNKALFNYSDEALSVFERHFIKRMVPFYKWMKNNLSKQMRVMLESPGRSVWLGHLKESGEATTEYDKSVMPDWMRDIYPVPLPITSKDGDPVMLSTAGLFPQGDLELLSGLLGGKFDPKDAFSSLSPILRTPLEVLFNKDLWYDSEIEKYPGEKKRVPSFVEKAADAMDGVPGLGDVWDFVAQRLGVEERDFDGSRYWVANAKALKVFRDLTPWLNSVSKALDEQARTPYDRFMFATGIKPVLYEQERFAKNQAYEDRATLQDVIQRLKDEQKIPAQQPRKATLADLFGSR